MGKLPLSNLISSEALWIVNNSTEHCVIGLPPYKDTTGRTLQIPLKILVSMYTFYTLSQVPFAFVNVYKQKKLKQVDLDVAWAFWWQCAWQVLWGLVFIPACWIPWPTPSGHNEASFSTFGQDLADSWTCFMGRNPHPEITSCSAEPVYGWFVLYCFFNVSCNLALMWLIKQLSSTWASIGCDPVWKSEWLLQPIRGFGRQVGAGSDIGAVDGADSVLSSPVDLQRAG